MRRTLLTAITVAFAFAPTAAQAHDVGQAWAERQAERAAYAWAAVGDRYAWQADYGLPPSHGHRHTWMVSIFKVNRSRTRVCGKSFVVRWVLFRAQFGKARAFSCDDPGADYSPEEFADLTQHDILAHFQDNWSAP